MTAFYAKKSDYEPPLCPNCGAPAEVDWMEVDGAWIPVLLTCSARCFESDRDAYLRAVNASR